MASLLDILFPNIGRGTPGINPGAPDPRGGILGMGNQELMRLATGRPHPLLNIGATIASLGGPIGQGVASGLRQQASQGRGAIQNLLMLHSLQEAQRKRGLLEQFAGLISGETPLPDEAARIAAAEEGQELPSRNQIAQGLLAQIAPEEFAKSMLSPGSTSIPDPRTSIVEAADGSKLLVSDVTGETVRVISGPDRAEGLQPEAVQNANLAFLQGLVNDPGTPEPIKRRAQRNIDAGAHRTQTLSQLQTDLGQTEARFDAREATSVDQRTEARKLAKPNLDLLDSINAIFDDRDVKIENGRVVSKRTGEPVDLPGVTIGRVEFGPNNFRLFKGKRFQEFTSEQRRFMNRIESFVNSLLFARGGKSLTEAEINRNLGPMGLRVDESDGSLVIEDEEALINGIQSEARVAANDLRSLNDPETLGRAGAAFLDREIKRRKIGRFLEPQNEEQTQAGPALTRSQAAALSFEEAEAFVNTVDQATWDALPESTKNAIKRALSK